MKKFLLMSVLVFMFIASHTQTVKVKKEKSTVKGESMEGYAVDLDGTQEEVSDAFGKLLKTLGKGKITDIIAKKSDVITVNEPNINGLTTKEPLYGVTSGNDKTSQAWLGYNPASLQKEDVDKLNKELEKVMKDFGVKFYRDKIQLQIDQSMAATQSVDRQKQKLVNENKSLNSKLEDNKREKLQLQKALQTNKQDSITLIKKLSLNKKAQDSVAVAGEQIKKVMEAQKEKQRKVN
jgi:hypothetical protein